VVPLPKGAVSPVPVDELVRQVLDRATTQARVQDGAAAA
jgi:hypothetical protein